MIAQAELTSLWAKILEEIRTGANVPTCKSEISTYARTTTGELLESGKSLLAMSATIQPESEILCPVCGKGNVRFSDKAAGCSEYKTGCKFVIRRKIAEKRLTDN